MSFVGKILVVLTLVLSVLFMAFAGAVFSQRVNWKKSYDTQTAALTKKNGDYNDLQTQLDAVKRDLEAKIKDATTRADALDAARRGLEQDKARLTKEVSDLQVARKTASEQSLISGQNADARKGESDKLRELNNGLTKLRDAEFAERVKLEDKVRNQQIELDIALKKNKDLLGTVAILRQALESAGLSADPGELVARSSPPPRVDGEVEVVKPAKKQGGVELVQVSLGSDDGLKKGHEMTVYRSALNGGQKSAYLARIVIVSTTPDQSVGQVIESSRKGVIKEGDNVTTKF